METRNPVGYVYQVVPDNPDWSKEEPAFEAHWSITFESPEERFDGVPGVKAIDVTPLYTNE